MSPSCQSSLYRLRLGVAACAAALAMLALAGWATGITVLAQGLPGLPAMPPLNAALLIVAAAAIAAGGALSRSMGLSLLLLGLALAGTALAGWPLLPPGLRVQPSLIGTIIVGGVGLLLRESRDARGVWLMQILTLLGMLNAVRALIGFLPVETDVLLVTHATGISLHGAVSLILLGLGLLATRPDAGFMPLLLSPRPAGGLLRWLMLAGIGTLIGAALLTELAWRAGLFGAGIGVILTLAGNLLVFYLVAAAYDRADQARRAAEGHLALANAALEQRVAERTAALADREAQIAAIGDNLPGAMIFQLAPGPTGSMEFTYISGGVRDVAGVEPEAVQSDPGLLQRMIAPEDRAEYQAREAAAYAALETFDAEVRKRTEAGLRWSHIRSRPRTLADGRLVWDGIEVDITPQKETQAAIERDRRHQAALFACSQDLLRGHESPADRQDTLRTALGHLLAGVQADRAFMIGLVELAGGEPYFEFRTEVCAPGITVSLGQPDPLRIPLHIMIPLVGDPTTLDEPITCTIDELGAMAPDFADLIADFGVRSLIMLPLCLSDGSWAGIGFHDCTAPRAWDEQEILLLRTAAELISGTLRRWAGADEVRRREELLATIFDILPVGVALTDATGAPIRINRTIMEIAGLTVEQVMAGVYLQLPYCTPDGQPLAEGRDPITRALGGEVVRDQEVGLRRPDGELRWLSLSAAPLSFHGVGVVLVAVEITERKRVEEERLHVERQLLEAQRLESLGVLAGGVAHDFNNILASILGHAELACLEVEPGGEAAVSLNAIILGARRAADLTGQMLAYAGRGRFLSEAVDLNLIARELGELTRATIPRGVRIHQRLAPALPPVVADGTQVRQVLLNLLTNAGEAMAASGEGGEISVVTGHCDLTPRLMAEAVVSAAAPGPFGFIEVSDTGGGIAPATLARIFEPFFSTKFTGRGLGLAAVQGIMRAHRGALFVHSTPGRGATFRACFPLAPNGAAEQRA